jgi:murein L,D-transpeptidase YcbB/YkuD
MTIKKSRIDLKTLAASAAVVGALALAPAAYAQTETDRTGPTGQPGQVQQQYGQQPGAAGGPGQQEGVGQTGRTGQMGQTGQQDQPGQRLGTAEQEQLERQRVDQQQMRQQAGQQQQHQQQQRGAQVGTETQLYVSSESIRHIQEALKEEHDKDIEVDGKWGPNTSSAIREFQEEEGLEATGQLNIATLQALGVAEQFGFQEVDMDEQRERDEGEDQQQRDEDRDADQQERQQQ